jgi:hypothetical protein
VPYKGITSVKGFLGALDGYAPNKFQEVFFRGHEDRAFTLTPSIFRNSKHLDNEHAMFMELLVSNPEEFVADITSLDKLVRMQHYELPTRLLDLTTNPLIALYFACLGPSDKDGEVIVFRVDRSEVRFFNSPTVSILSNLSRLTKAEKDALNLALERADFNDLVPVKKLCDLVSGELPGFKPDIDPTDMDKFIIVRSKLNNARIAAQSGAFAISGLKTTFEAMAGVVIDRIRVDDANKPKILNELLTLNIGERTVYPAIEKSAKFIKAKYA